MQTFDNQLAATRANLERLEALAAQSPELFEFASLIEVSPEHSRVYIHASRDRERDWRAWARRCPQANWKRESSPSDWSYYDFTGFIGDVEISILQAERKQEPQPLFAEEGVVA